MSETLTPAPVNEDRKAELEAVIEGMGPEFKEAIYGLLFASPMLREKFGSYEGLKKLMYSRTPDQILADWKTLSKELESGQHDLLSVHVSQV